MHQSISRNTVDVGSVTRATDAAVLPFTNIQLLSHLISLGARNIHSLIISAIILLIGLNILISGLILILLIS